MLEMSNYRKISVTSGTKSKNWTKCCRNSRPGRSLTCSSGPKVIKKCRENSRKTAGASPTRKNSQNLQSDLFRSRNSVMKRKKLKILSEKRKMRKRIQNVRVSRQSLPASVQTPLSNRLNRTKPTSSLSTPGPGTGLLFRSKNTHPAPQNQNRPSLTKAETFLKQNLLMKSPLDRCTKSKAVSASTSMSNNSQPLCRKKTSPLLKRRRPSLRIKGLRSFVVVRPPKHTIEWPEGQFLVLITDIL
jgi:hypothetical protein